MRIAVAEAWRFEGWDWKRNHVRLIGVGPARDSSPNARERTETMSPPRRRSRYV
jgi:hypothetical protein